MNDFESRVRDALAAGVTAAPDGTGLAHAARSRLRRRRRTTLAGAVAAVVLAAVAVPVGLSVSAGDDATAPIAVDPNRPADGWRTETWRQATIKVPDDWGYGSMESWCAGNTITPPTVVDRPGSSVYYIACRPQRSFGVSFRAARTDGYDAPQQVSDGSVPDGAWVGEQASAGVLVSVVTPTEEMAQRILDSMQGVGNVDPNGCSEVSDFATDGPDDGISVCRYDDQHQLVQSEVLTGADAVAARDAITAAPAAPSVSPCSGTPAKPAAAGGGEYVLLNDQGRSTTVDWAGPCRERGVFTTDTIQELTADVLYWALSPGWSGSVDRDVPMPSQFRTR